MTAIAAITPMPCACPAPHPTAKDLAGCLWPDAGTVAGEGTYALVARFPLRAPTVLLWMWADDALDALLSLRAAAEVDGVPGEQGVYRLPTDRMAVSA